MKRVISVTMACAALAFSQSGLAEGDVAAGKEKSAACVACHAEDGNSPSAQFPRIGGQHGSYLQQALMDYKSGARNNPIMKGIVAQLSEQDMANLAAYFASQDGSLRTLE